MSSKKITITAFLLLGFTLSSVKAEPCSITSTGTINKVTYESTQQILVGASDVNVSCTVAREVHVSDSQGFGDSELWIATADNCETAGRMLDAAYAVAAWMWPGRY